MPASLEQLSKTLQKFNKENLIDIMHVIATELKRIFNSKIVRIYLEDLYEGILISQYVTGQDPTGEERMTQYIPSKGSIIYQTFYENKVAVSSNLPQDFASSRSPFEKYSGINASVAFPITCQLRPIGVLSLDWNEQGKFLSPSQIEKIHAFLSENSARIDRAKRFHQKINFSKHLDLARKKEAAWVMLRSAVKLIEKLTLASVIVPASAKTAHLSAESPVDQVEILAVYSKNDEDAVIYNAHDRMSILTDQNLLNQIVKYDPVKGLIAHEPTQQAIYIEDIMSEQFARKPIAKKLDLVSLYQIPKFHKKTHQFICAVNYYANTPHRFIEFEKRLLEEHASMVEKLVLEEGPARVEIQVLSEIEELLSDPNNSLQNFLSKILDKTSELLGADSGTISLVKIIDGQPWPTGLSAERCAD